MSSFNENFISSKQAIHFVDAFSDSDDCLKTFFFPTSGIIIKHSTNACERDRKTGSAKFFKQGVNPLSLLKNIPKYRQGSQVNGVGPDTHQVINHARKFGENNAHGDRLRRNSDSKHSLHHFAKTHVVHGGGAIVETIRVGNNLIIKMGFRHFFKTAVKIADFYVATIDGFSIELGHNSKSSVSRRVTGADIDRNQVFIGVVAVPLIGFKPNIFCF